MANNDNEIVNRVDFNLKIENYFTSHSNSNNRLWNLSQEKLVIEMLTEIENGVKKTQKHYRVSKSYELVKISGEIFVAQKRKNTNDPLIYLVPYENCYDKLLEAHIQTGHGGRDRMFFYAKTKWVLSKNSCAIFASMCTICNRKRAAPKKHVVTKPILSDNFNTRGQMDLIDLQSCRDGEYCWLMNYQDHHTKFLHLRSLKSKHAANVAEELLKIFFCFGAPAILQSDNGREFVANVISELVAMWPHCRIVHGRPRHPQTQGSVERANGDIENSLRAWMLENSSTNWSRGCYEVQVKKHSFSFFKIHM